MPEVPACPDVARYQQLQSGRLPPEEQETLLTHLENCDACARKVETLPNHDSLVTLLKESQTHAHKSSEKIAMLVERLAKHHPMATLATGDGTQVPPQPASTGSNPLDATLAFEGAAAGRDPSLTDFLSPSQAGDELGRLGKYRILKVLGHGGMGVVYQAEDPMLKRLVALKAMLPTLAVSASAGKRFVREAQAMAAVEHDHVVRVHEVSEERGIPFLAMEFLRGEPLDVRLERDKQLPVMEVVRLGKEIAEGLEAAHERGLIHRDIKPGNIWLEAPRGRVKILDFGLARSAAQDAGLTQQGAIIGTPAYMSPEQGRGEEVDARSDLFSLGVLLYRLSSGRVAFRGKDTVSTLMAVATEQPQPPRVVNPVIPTELSRLVMQLLEKEPKNRPASASVVVQTLQALEKKLLREQDATEPTPSPKKLAASAKRSRMPVLVGVLLLLLAGLVGAGLWASGIFRVQTEQGDLVLESDDEDFAFSPVKNGGVTLEDRKAKRTYALKVVPLGKDKYQLEVIDKTADLVFNTETFTVKRGDKVALKAWFERKEVVAVKPTMSNGATPRPAIDEAWLKEVAAMPAEKQVEAVIAKLKDRNPGFDGKLTERKIEKEVVVELGFFSADVADISPLQALPGLQIVKCQGAQVKDLLALRGHKLTHLNCSNTQIADLSPLKGMPLTWLWCVNTKVTDLSPLKDLPLKEIHIRFMTERDAEILRSIKTLERINEKPAAEFLKNVKDANKLIEETWFKQVAAMPAEKQVEAVAARLKEQNPNFDGKVSHKFDKGVVVALEFKMPYVAGSDLSPLRALPGLESLDILAWHALKDLSPLQGMKLTSLRCGGGTSVSDLTPLKGMPLRKLDINWTPVSDLSPLKGMPLEDLNIARTGVKDLSLLKELPLKNLTCYLNVQRDGAILRSIKTLETINGKPVADYWKAVDASAKPIEEVWFQRIAALSAAKQQEAVRAKLKERSPDLDTNWVKTTTEGDAVTELRIYSSNLLDLAPVAALTKLQRFECRSYSHVLPPCQVTDLSPLRGLKLTSVKCSDSHVADLSPLKDMKLTYLDCHGSRVTDLTPVKDMPIQEIICDFKPERDTAILRGIKTLQKINGKPVAEFLKNPTNPATPIEENWFEEVAALPPDKQVEAVVAKLKERNPGFDGQVEHLIEGGSVTRMKFVADHVTDISPVRALTALRFFDCYGSRLGSGRLADLSPLASLPLTVVGVAATQVSDLTPLKGMKLVVLNCGVTPVTDLSPLKDMPLVILNCDFKPERDAEILRSIKTLEKINSKPAAEFWKEVEGANKPIEEAWFKQVAALPAEKQVEAVRAKLKERNPNWKVAVRDQEAWPTIDNGVVTGLRVNVSNLLDITPLQALSGLRSLTLSWPDPQVSCLADASPLQGMKLTHLSLVSPGVTDLSPLQGMPLTILDCGWTRVTDLSPLRGMKLTSLGCGKTLVTDLSPLQGMPLTTLNLMETKVQDLSPLKDMPLVNLTCPFKPERDAEILRAIKTLEKINEKPAAEFWKEVDKKP